MDIDKKKAKKKEEEMGALLPSIFTLPD